MRWLSKIIRVFMVVALGAAGSLPFRRLPPPGLEGSPSADRLVLQNDSARTVQELPLQIAPSGGPAAEGRTEFGADAAGEPRTADNRAPQATRKDLPVWNSRLESSPPPPALPDTFDGRQSTPASDVAPQFPYDGS